MIHISEVKIGELVRWENIPFEKIGEKDNKYILFDLDSGNMMPITKDVEVDIISEEELD